MSHTARLAAVAHHGDYAAALAFVPPSPSALDHCLPGVMVLAGILAVVRAVSSIDDLVAALLAILLVVPWLVVAILLGRDLWRRRTRPLRARIARVVNTHTSAEAAPAGGSFVLLHLESGLSARLACHPGLSAALDVDDVGVAYESGGRLVAFRRFDV